LWLLGPGRGYAGGCSPQRHARGSTIEAVGGDLYRVCDGSHHCRTVPGLWQAQELAHQAELKHLHPEQLP
jgi:hypothetical protein